MESSRLRFSGSAAEQHNRAHDVSSRKPKSTIRSSPACRRGPAQGPLSPARGPEVRTRRGAAARTNRLDRRELRLEIAGFAPCDEVDRVLLLPLSGSRLFRSVSVPVRPAIAGRPYGNVSSCQGHRQLLPEQPRFVRIAVSLHALQHSMPTARLLSAIPRRTARHMPLSPPALPANRNRTRAENRGGSVSRAELGNSARPHE